ncbi:MAG: glycosyltransferase family 1 protein [Chloroflexi bacterium]|nr:glycosyltransferase family 1 protein [Chloroflexota bacterium]
MKILGAISVFPPTPPQLTRLHELAFNLWWAWSPLAQHLFKEIDAHLWEETNHNPIKLLRAVDSEKLQQLAKDADFLELYEKVLTAFDAYMHPESTWFSRTYPQHKDDTIAYFSAEFGLHEALPIYSGGLGVLSGDHCKSASDLGIPLVGVGFLYPQGYFKQQISEDGTQEAIYEKLEFAEAPAQPALDANGQEIVISVDLPGRTVYAKVWRIQVGRIPIFLMDTDVSLNRPEDRVLAARLYGGDQEMRVAQEVVLGLGGVRALRALDIHPTVFHLNEGHAAFLNLERVRELVQEEHLSFFQAQQVVAASSVFTTHTPVPAGNDAFPFELMDKFFYNYWGLLGLDRAGFMNLARWQTPWGERFSMTVLALRFAAFANGVSRLHGHVARKMWAGLWPDVPTEEIPITSVTNGVHTDTWLASEMGILYDRYLGTNWREEPDMPDPWQKIANIPNRDLWDVHRDLRIKLLEFIRERVAIQRRRHGETPSRVDAAHYLFDPNALTIGFARRFATYKRATLIFHDIERIKRILNNPEKPVQIIFSGKAHPADEPGKALIKQVHQLAQTPEFEGKIIFIENYDMNIARHLVQGVDLWLNNPRRPNEASGTSGEKAALNGIPNFSVRDGWWDEGYNGENGWVIGEEREYKDEKTQDEADASSLYNVLENEIIPAYFEQAEDGTHDRWAEIMKEAIRSCAPRFSMSRQVKDYLTKLYLPAIVAGKQRMANNYERARSLATWKDRTYRAWPQVRLNAQPLTVDRVAVGDELTFEAKVFLGSLNPSEVLVELVWGWRTDDDELTNIHAVPMQASEDLPGGLKRYECSIKFEDNGRFGYGIRIIPQHADLITKHELGLVKWA